MKAGHQIQVPLPAMTEEQARILRERYRQKKTTDALLTLALAIAGIWALSEIVKESEKPRRRRKRA